jgi:hypothetical protein
MSGPTARRGGAHLGRWNVSGLGCRDSRDEAITRKGIDLFFAWKQSMAFFSKLLAPGHSIGYLYVRRYVACADSFHAHPMCSILTVRGLCFSCAHMGPTPPRHRPRPSRFPRTSHVQHPDLILKHPDSTLAIYV